MKTNDFISCSLFRYHSLFRMSPPQKKTLYQQQWKKSSQIHPPKPYPSISKKEKMGGGGEPPKAIPITIISLSRLNVNFAIMLGKLSKTPVILLKVHQLKLAAMNTW